MSPVDLAGVPTQETPIVVAVDVDPARRPDVLLRVRREPGYELSVWWSVSAFLVVCAALLIAANALPAGT